MKALSQKQIILGLAAIISVHCMTESSAFADDGMVKECRQLYRKYQAQRIYKAFAATPIMRGRQACGYSYSYYQQMEANRIALWECKRGRQQVFGREKTTCRLMK